MIRNQFIRDRTGEGYVDVAIAILLIFTVIAGIFSLFPIYTTYQSLNATARQIAHVLEAGHVWRWRRKTDDRHLLLLWILADSDCL